jgi:galactose mutarotase-like enzyme
MKSNSPPMTRFRTALVAALMLALGPLSALRASTTGAGRYAVEIAAAQPEFLVLVDRKAGIEATIAPRQGGELSGLRVFARGEWQELIFRARDYRPTAGWRGKAPILWPAVGRNFSRSQRPDPNADACSYDLNGRHYNIPIHGFAREQEWTLVEQGADDTGAYVELRLTDTPRSREQYPFGFDFRLCYRLAGGRLELQHRITAAGENAETMAFSIGNHVTFRTPLMPGSAPSDLLLQTPSRVEFVRDAATLPTGEVRERSYTNPVRLGDVALMPALGLGGYDGDPWVRLIDPAGMSVLVKHRADRYPEEPHIQFNLWGAPTRGFFSPEPWIGLNNSLNSGKGVVRLAPGETWRWWIEISVEVPPARLGSP